jgi:hypothetical protein
MKNEAPTKKVLLKDQLLGSLLSWGILLAAGLRLGKYGYD